MTGSATEVVILGGTGFIGQRLTDRLRDRQVAVSPSQRRQVISLSSRDCDLLDLRSPMRQFATASNATTFVICAGISRLAGDSWSLFQQNLTMVRNVLKSLEHVQPRSIVFLSSTDVYGLPPAALPITELTLPQPTTYYGLAKLACERTLALGELVNCPVACLRLPGIYGPTDDGRSVVGRFCRQLSMGRSIQLSGDGSVLRDFVHVDDLCALIESLIAAPQATTLNVATGHSLAMHEIADQVVRKLHRLPSPRAELIETIPRNAERDHHLTFETGRLRAGFPAISFRTVSAGVDDYLAQLNEAG